MKSLLATLTLLLASAATVHASPVAPGDDVEERAVSFGYTTVTAVDGVDCQVRPTTHSEVLRVFGYGARIKYACYVMGEIVNHNSNIWIKVDPGPKQAWCWVPAVYTTLQLPYIGNGGQMACPSSDWPSV